MLTVEQALERLREAAGPPRRRVEHVALADALGRVLAEDVPMDHDVPPFRRAMMDGLAVRAGDVRVGATLPVQASVTAGAMPAQALRPGHGMRVMTGAPVPAGAQRVLPFEWLVQDGARSAQIERLGSEKSHIAEVGSHLHAGDRVATAGAPVTPGACGALASAGCARVPVAARPRVAVLGTGTELVAVDAQPGPACIRNSNGAALQAQARRVGAAVVDLGFVGDESGALRAAIRRGLESDCLVLSGGVSFGDKDLVPAALQAEGVRCVFHHWAVQPGGPLWCGVRGDTLVFGLPGNPAAAFVGFEVLVVPALRTRLGLPLAPRTTLTARYAGPWGEAGPRRRFRPARLATDEAGTLIARATPWRGSGDPFGLAAGDALVVFTEHRDAPNDGAPCVPVLPLTEAFCLWGGA